ncbi:unnamed protein product [Effrenium voratum]|uniref:Uncharacterized protein n=1 Tax=Effrenium voratum TaxID=2562239 RepID=A0AA36N5E6_9DINO|nr:unnamed protein product [Effrenium voratum]
MLESPEENTPKTPQPVPRETESPSGTSDQRDRTASACEYSARHENPEENTPRTPQPLPRETESPDAFSSQRSPGAPKMEDQHFGLRFQDSAAAGAKWIAANQHADHMQNLLNSLGVANDELAARKLLFSDNFATGMGTAKDTASTVKDWLRMVADEERGHRVVSSDISFDLRRCLPAPFMQAVKSLSEGNGLRDEALAWCFYANIAFLKHHGRRVGHKSGERTEAPNIPALVGGPPSSRKTCLTAMTTDFLLQAPEAPQLMQKRECIIADATVAGIRSAIFNYNRAAVVADEASNVYETPWSEKGRHPYLFLHKVAGQTEIIEFIAQPVAHGFNKRFNLVFAPERSPESAEVHTASAKAFFTQLHTWLCKNAWGTEGNHYLDGYALTCYQSVKQAAEDFMEERGGQLTKDACRKVRFWSTDFSVVEYGGKDVARTEAARTQPNVYEFILAVNMWLRQLHAHFSFYKWFRHMSDQRPGGSTKDLTAAMERADDGEERSRLKANLSAEDRLRHEILVHEKAAVGAKIAGDQADTQSPLANVAEAKRKTKKGIKVVVYIKKSAREIGGNADAEAARTRLLVPIKYF